MFHGEGVVYLAQGGRFESTWDRGRLIGGRYFFEDNLAFEPTDWQYCDSDRRFWTELQSEVKIQEKPQFTDRTPEPVLPYGCFDVGDGYFNPHDAKIYKYTGEFLRIPTAQEAEWAQAKCRVGIDRISAATAAYRHQQLESTRPQIPRSMPPLGDFCATSAWSTRPPTAAAPEAGVPSNEDDGRETAGELVNDDAEADGSCPATIGGLYESGGEGRFVRCDAVLTQQTEAHVHAEAGARVQAELVLASEDPSLDLDHDDQTANDTPLTRPETAGSVLGDSLGDSAATWAVDPEDEEEF